MSIQSEHERRIRAYIEDNPACDTKMYIRLEIEGKAIDLPVFRLPIKFLTFNLENGRFAADLKDLEGSQRRKLNLWEEEDRNLIRKILIDKYPSETKRLREDLKKVGQLDPGIITAAGVAINGNRRMAILIDLFEKTSEDRYSFLDVAILPKHLDDKEIYKIEARLQYAKDFKIKYGPVNELLKIRDGTKKGMSEKSLAILLGVDGEDIREKLNRLKLMENYSLYRWKKIDYKNLEEEEVTEHFIDMQKNLKKYRDEDFSASETKKLVGLHFALIQSKYPHLGIRKLGRIDGIRGVKEAYFEALKKWQDHKVTDEVFVELVEDANETVRIKRKDEKPVQQLEHAISVLERIRDEQLEITSEIKKFLIKAFKIIGELLD